MRHLKIELHFSLNFREWSRNSDIAVFLELFSKIKHSNLISPFVLILFIKSSTLSKRNLINGGSETLVVNNYTRLLAKPTVPSLTRLEVRNSDLWSNGKKWDFIKKTTIDATCETFWYSACGPSFTIQVSNCHYFTNFRIIWKQMYYFHFINWSMCSIYFL